MSASINNQSLSIPQNGIAIVDQGTKLTSKVWWQFFNNLYSRVGGASANLVPNVPMTVTGTTYSVSQFDTTLVFHITAACVVTLPTPTNTQSQTVPSPILYLTNTSAFAVTSASANVIPLGSNTAGTAILSTTGKFAMLQWTGNNWRVIMSN